MVADDEQDAFDIVAEILSFLPDHTLAEPLVLRGSDAWDRKCEGLEELVPSDPNRPYDMRKVIREIVDEGRFLELSEYYAENVVWIRKTGRAFRGNRGEPTQCISRMSGYRCIRKGSAIHQNV